ncbi:MAG TPA: hypothetical protein VMP67_10960 [Candidatus Limnocylindria bacterium]|nr:hypothetical protein [Candidatus Limnocylindria bacterium]
MDEQTRTGQPAGPDLDDSPNPTHAAPEHEQHAPPGAAETAYASDSAGAAGVGGDAGATGASQSRDMLQQLQTMIDSLATQAGPVLREVAAKAAELAAVAGERAGPIAHRAAEATERVGVRVAARSKEMAGELRHKQAQEAAATETAPPPAENHEAAG